MNFEEKEKEYANYISKIRMLGVENIEEIIVKYKSSICIDLCQFAMMMSCPKCLTVPKFVTTISDNKGVRQNRSKLSDDERNSISNVEVLIFPNDVTLNEAACRVISEFYNVIKISIPIEEAGALMKFKVDLDLRIGTRINTLKGLVKSGVVKFVADKYEADIADKTDGLFRAFELAVYMWDDDLATIALLVSAVDEGVISIDEIKAYGFNINIVDALDAFVKKQAEKSSDYMLRIIQNESLKLVLAVKKVIDIRDNAVSKNLKAVYASMTGFENISFDTGEGLKATISDPTNALAESRYTGSVKNFDYYITGNKVSTDVAKNIIRLTSNYQYASIKPSVLLMNLNIFEQHWLEKNMDSVWCYPNGAIYAHGFKEKETSVYSIMREMSKLTMQFPSLTLSIRIVYRSPYNKCGGEELEIKFTIHQGTLSIDRSLECYSNTFAKQSDIAYFDYDRINGKEILDKETLAWMDKMNRIDDESEQGQYVSWLCTKSGNSEGTIYTIM